MPGRTRPISDKAGANPLRQQQAAAGRTTAPAKQAQLMTAEQGAKLSLAKKTGQIAIPQVAQQQKTTAPASSSNDKAGADGGGGGGGGILAEFPDDLRVNDPFEAAATTGPSASDVVPPSLTAPVAKSGPLPIVVGTGLGVGAVYAGAAALGAVVSLPVIAVGAVAGGLIGRWFGKSQAEAAAVPVVTTPKV